MPGPRYTSPNGPGKRSEAMREIIRKRFGDYGSDRRDLNNRHDRKPKPKNPVDRAPVPRGYTPPTTFPRGTKVPGHWGKRA